MTRVVIIGAGVSGLATADDLVARGFDVTVLERQTKVGGNARSDRFDGFLMERGPTTLNAAFAPAMERIRTLGLESGSVGLGEGVRKRYLRDGATLNGISTHRLGFFLSGYLSWRARLRLLTEAVRPRRSGETEETIHSFVSRRFGSEFADKVIEPMAAGIFMGDAKQLSIGGAFPKLVEMEQRYGSILRAVVSAQRGSEPGRHLFSWPQGIGTLPQRLAQRLGRRVRTGIAVNKISRTPSGFEIATARDGVLNADAVVLAVQPHVAAMLLNDVDREGAEALAAISAPPIGVVFLGYRRAQVTHPLDGLGFLSTKGAGQVISGAQFSSTMFENRAPEGHVAISAYVGGVRNPELAVLPESKLAGAVHNELARLLGIEGAPVVVRCHQWARGLPQYTLGHVARRDAIESTPERVPGLYLTGNFITGVSITSCLEQAGKTAAALSGAFEAERNEALRHQASCFATFDNTGRR